MSLSIWGCKGARTATRLARLFMVFSIVLEMAFVPALQAKPAASLDDPNNIVTAGGSAQLQVSHFECDDDVSPPRVWLHFTFTNAPGSPNYTTKSVSVTITTPSGTFYGSAAYQSKTGGTVHFSLYNSSWCEGGSYTVTSAQLNLGSWGTYNAHNLPYAATIDSLCCTYTLCSQTSDWVLTSTGPWHYHADTGKVCRDKTYVKYDEYDTDYVCQTKTEEDCSYVLCTETTDWVRGTEGAWYWDATEGKVCRLVTYNKFDKYDTTHVCETEQRKECTYVLCTEMTDWQDIAWRWYYKAAQMSGARTYLPQNNVQHKLSIDVKPDGPVC